MKMKKNIIISDFDLNAYHEIRKNIKIFLNQCSKKYDKKGALVLDIAPQIHEGAKMFFKKSIVKTLDIDPKSNSTFILDITKNNSKVIKSNHFDIVVCTEVLEHTIHPFKAVDEIYRILKTGGVAIITTPFNFRIHGPLPDCWRFTRFGLKILFKEFKAVDIKEIETPGRDLMPLQYTIVLRK